MRTISHIFFSHLRFILTLMTHCYRCLDVSELNARGRRTVINSKNLLERLSFGFLSVAPGCIRAPYRANWDSEVISTDYSPRRHPSTPLSSTHLICKLKGSRRHQIVNFVRFFSPHYAEARSAAPHYILYCWMWNHADNSHDLKLRCLRCRISYSDLQLSSPRKRSDVIVTLSRRFVFSSHRSIPVLLAPTCWASASHGPPKTINLLAGTTRTTS
jgi:hypothetical protein